MEGWCCDSWGSWVMQNKLRDQLAISWLATHCKLHPPDCTPPTLAFALSCAGAPPAARHRALAPTAIHSLHNTHPFSHNLTQPHTTTCCPFQPQAHRLQRDIERTRAELANDVRGYGALMRLHEPRAGAPVSPEDAVTRERAQVS